MSSVYFRRLRGVQAEFEAAREAISYIQRNWHRHDIYVDLPRMKPTNFNEAGINVERTYFIRLYAEFEGILKDHLATNYPSLSVPDKPKVDWLISHVAKAEGFTIDANLSRKMNALRDYRNSIAHRTRALVPTVTLADALSTLNTFVVKLPDPSH